MAKVTVSHNQVEGTAVKSLSIKVDDAVAESITVLLTTGKVVILDSGEINYSQDGEVLSIREPLTKVIYAVYGKGMWLGAWKTHKGPEIISWNLY